MNILKNSYIYKLIIGLATLVEKTVCNSYIYQIFTREINKKDKMNESIFTKILYAIVRFFKKIFKALKLDKLFRDSIFEKTYIWIGITIALVPFLSTIQSLILVFICFISLIIKICMKDNFEFKYTPVNIWVLLFIFVYGFCAIFSIDFTSSIKVAMVVVSFILMYFVIINGIDSKKQLQIMLLIFILSGFVVSLYGIYQYVFSTFFGSKYVDNDMFTDIKTRVDSTFQNPNVLGEYLLLVIPIVVSEFFTNKGILKKTLLIFVFATTVLCLALTYSRGCYLGLLFSAAIFVLLLNFKFIVLFIAGIIALPFVLPKSIINRFKSIGNVKDTSTSYRLNIWYACIEIIKDYWYKPIGQGEVAFNKIYPLYSYNMVSAPHSHNLYLQMIIETGIVGLLMFICLIFRLYQFLFSRLKKIVKSIDRIYVIGFISAISGFLLQSFTDYTWYNYRLILIFWMVIGLSCKCDLFCKEENAEDDKSS